ncbi:TIGR03899 family protein [Photobacterium aquimaris]|uniref:TIGR03899 family protein n=2 Tax=Photobacterium aquimaris TaxID=512643 RepID=A0A2T3HZ44_9GAMM|nr:TIGR03899 family protein [Photobacterium aquimaris]PSU06004.1 TIGR03899 family protein [Photobacterium aquimaris]
MAAINSGLIVNRHFTMTSTQQTLKNTLEKRPLTNSKSRAHSLAQYFGYDYLINSNHNNLSPAERYLHSQQLQYQREQQNIEKIFKLTYDECKNEATTDPDQDWLVRFIKMAKQVYSPSMQILWARILKKELILPGSTSLNTLTVLITMTQKETLLFQRVISVCCQLGKKNNKVIITSIKIPSRFIQLGKKIKHYPIVYDRYNLPYSSIIILMDLGLILKTEFESSTIDHTMQFHLHLQNTHYSLNCHNKNTSLTYYRLSPIGQEIASLIEYKNNSEFQAYLLEILSQQFTVTTG